MSDLTLYRADMEKIKFAIRVAQARWQRQGLMSLAQECDALGDLVNERLRLNLHPERATQGESD